MTLALETNSEAAQVKSGSPGDKAGLVAYFDYIVSANGVPLVRVKKQKYCAKEGKK